VELGIKYTISNKLSFGTSSFVSFLCIHFH
jgi:hypothetical protein